MFMKYECDCLVSTQRAQKNNYLLLLLVAGRNKKRDFISKIMFKIVENIEKGIEELAVLPMRWEQCGTLFWPKKFAYKYQQESALS